MPSRSEEITIHFLDLQSIHLFIICNHFALYITCEFMIKVIGIQAWEFCSKHKTMFLNVVISLLFCQFQLTDWLKLTEQKRDYDIQKHSFTFSAEFWGYILLKLQRPIHWRNRECSWSENLVCHYQPIREAIGGLFPRFY